MTKFKASCFSTTGISSLPVTLLALVALLVLSGRPVMAQDAETWAPTTAGTFVWSTGTNWTGSTQAPPVAADTSAFTFAQDPGGTITINSLGAAYKTSSITFSGTTSYTINGSTNNSASDSFQMQSGSTLTDNSSGTITLNAELEAASGVFIINGSGTGTLDLFSLRASGSNKFDFERNATVENVSAINGASTIEVDNGTTLNFGDTSVSGLSTIGTIVVGTSAGGSGNGSSTLVNGSGQAINLVGNVTLGYSLSNAATSVTFGAGSQFTFTGSTFTTGQDGAAATITNNTGSLLSFSNALTDGGNFSLLGANGITFSGAFNVGGSAGKTLVFDNSGGVTLSGSTSNFGNTSTTAARTVTIQTGTGGASIANAISDSGTFTTGLAFSAISSGPDSGNAGTTTLTGINTYRGGTAINAGTTVLFNNPSGSGSGTGAVSLANGATLGGTGFLAPTGTSTISLGGTVQPGAGGNAISTLTFDIHGTTLTASPVVTAAGSGTFSFNLSSPGSGVNFLNIITSPSTPFAGEFTFNGNTLSLTNVSGGALSLGNYTLFQVDTTMATTPGFFAGVTLGAPDGSGGNYITGLNPTGLSGYTYLLEENTVSGDTDIQLDITSAPEPSTWAMLAGGLAFLMFRLRRRNGTSL